MDCHQVGEFYLCFRVELGIFLVATGTQFLNFYFIFLLSGLSFLNHLPETARVNQHSTVYIVVSTKTEFGLLMCNIQ